MNSIPPTGRPRLASRHERGDVLVWARTSPRCLDCSASAPISMIPEEARALARSLLSLAAAAELFRQKQMAIIEDAADALPHTERSAQ